MLLRRNGRILRSVVRLFYTTTSSNIDIHWLAKLYSYNGLSAGMFIKSHRYETATLAILKTASINTFGVPSLVSLWHFMQVLLSF